MFYKVTKPLPRLALKRLLKLPVLGKLLLDHGSNLGGAGAEGQAAGTTKALADKGVESVLGTLDTGLDNDKVGTGDAVLEDKRLGHGLGVTVDAGDSLGVEAVDGLGEDVAGAGDAALVARNEGGEEPGVSEHGRG